jgi:hypothetical protein
MSSSRSAAAPAVADGDAPLLSVSFSVQASAEPGIMPRVVELFAKRGLVPHKWHSTVSGAVLTIDLQIAGIGRGPADYIARSMRQIYGVEAVLTSETRAAG